MRTVLGNVQHAPVFRAQFHATPFAEGGRIRPEVERNVKDRAPGAAHQFCLQRRRYLQMQSANRTLARAELHVGLDWQKVDSLFFEFPYAPRPQKAATIIVMRADVDDPSACHPGVFKMHRLHDMSPYPSIPSLTFALSFPHVTDTVPDSKLMGVLLSALPLHFDSFSVYAFDLFSYFLSLSLINKFSVVLNETAW